LVYLPRFTLYVFKHFPSARFAVIVAVFGVILEYLALSVMLPLANANTQNVSSISSSVLDIWRRAAGLMGLADEPRTWLWLFLLLLGIRIIIGFAQITLNTWVSKSIHVNLSGETFSRVVKSEPLSEIYRRSVGYYISLAGDEAVRVGQVFFNLAQMLSALIAAAIGLIVLLIFSPIVFKLTLVFLFLSGLSIGLATKRVFSWSHESAVICREASTTFIEAFNGVRSIRSMAGEEFVAKRYRNALDRYGRVLFFLDVFNHGSRALPGLILIVLGLGALFPSINLFPDFSPIFFFTVTTMLIRVLSFLGTVVSSGGRVAIDLRAAFDLDDIISESAEHNPTSVVGEIISDVSNITISNLSCGYACGHPVLTEISVQMNAGFSYALVGKSGTGKSTLSDVLLGLLPPMSGILQIGNLQYNQIDLLSLRRKVVLVEQQTRIFSDTVHENIAFGLYPSDEEIEAAVKAADLNEFINSLPNGLATRLDYQGANLSGGQRQRIGLARALVRCPDVLILDEATSALDGQTRDKILQNLQVLFHDKILFFITHDAHIMQIVDEIWHLKKGKLIVETKV